MKMTLVCLTVLLTGIAVGAAKDDPPPKTYELPEEATAEVISLDFKGGFTPPRLRNSPTLSILRDGTVLIPDNYGQSQTVKARLTQAELQELLAFIIEKHRFFEFDPKKVQAAVKETEKPKKDKQGNLTISVAPRVADAPNTVIKVELKDREHQADWYALSMAATQYPDVRALSDLRAVEQRLQRVMIVAHAGGNDEVARQLKVVNDKVKAEHPEAPALNAGHLLSASRRPDGTRAMLWQWVETGKDGTAATARYVMVNQQIPMTGDATFKIDVKLK